MDHRLPYRGLRFRFLRVARKLTARLFNASLGIHVKQVP